MFFRSLAINAARSAVNFCVLENGFDFVLDFLEGSRPGGTPLFDLDDMEAVGAFDHAREPADGQRIEGSVTGLIP